MRRMSLEKAQLTTVLVATVILPVWVISVCKWSVAYGYGEGFKAAVLSGASLVMAVPCGLIVGLVIAPIIYGRCETTGLRRYGRSGLIHAGACLIVLLLLAILNMAGGMVMDFSPQLAQFALSPVAWVVVLSPWLAVPSLVGTLVFAYLTSPQPPI